MTSRAGAATRDLVAAGVRRIAQIAPRRSDWRHLSPRRDVTAGLTVGLVALPLALGFGASTGMGATAGLVTAIVAGAVAALFGGSRVQVSGPTGAMAVVLIPIVATHGPDGVLVVGILAGLILVGLAVAGGGRFIRYVPISVVEGFTLGIAVIIAVQQVPAVLGVQPRGEQVLVVAGRAARTWVEGPSWAPLLLATGTAGGILLLARFRPRLPWSLIAVAAASAGNLAFNLGADTIGAIPASLPVPSLPGVPLAELDALLLPAVAVAALAALESLLSATVADGLSVGQRHDSDRELLGQGLANLAAPLFGGIPATAAIARTAVNVRSGATSRLAALVHAALLLGVVLVAADLVGRIPLAALAGVLVATAVQMVRVSGLLALVRSTKGDAAVLAVTALATVAFDLVTAVLLGLAVAGFVALRQTARSARLEETSLDEGDHTAEERSLLDDHIVCYRLEGPLFFGAAHDFLLELAEVSDVRVVVLRLSRVVSIDATGAHVLADTVARLERRGVTVLLSGVQARHQQVLTELGVYDGLAHERHVFDTTLDAIAHARVHAARIAHLPAD